MITLDSWDFPLPFATCYSNWRAGNHCSAFFPRFALKAPPFRMSNGRFQSDTR